MDALDHLVEMVFRYLFPLAFACIGIAGFGWSIFCAFFQDDFEGFDRIEAVAAGFLLMIIAYGYFVWWGQMWEDGVEEGYSHVPAVLAGFIAMIAIWVPAALKMIGVPFFVSLILYVLIAFGTT